MKLGMIIQDLYLDGRAMWDAGIRTLLLNPLASEPEERVSQLSRLSELSKELKASL